MRMTKQTMQPGQIWDNTMNTQPIPAERSLRMDMKRVLTSGNAGKFLPLAMIPLLREDGLRASRFRVSVEMNETASMLLNAVQVNVQAHFVPKLAFERFNGIDSFNRSYAGEPEANGDPISFIYWDPFEDNEIYRTLGLHATVGTNVNRDYLESYNVLWNYLAKQRSESIAVRFPNQTDLAPAFWRHTAMKHVKPDFDQAMIDGEVPLNVVDGISPIRTAQNPMVTGAQNAVFYSQADGGPIDQVRNLAADVSGAMGTAQVHSEGGLWHGIYPNNLYAELEQEGITVSLSNIDLARQTATFARMRNTYRGIPDEFLIDILMSGIRVPQLELERPILLGEKSTIMGMSQRYATDAENLDKSATRGVTDLEMMIAMPPTNVGGQVVITAEVTPEQLYERQKDYYFHTTDVSQLPEYLRDRLDPEPVTVIRNDHVDVKHSVPNGVFGYAPLNAEWMRQGPNIGGRFHRPDPEQEWTEDRQRIWAVESVDPVLNEDFYLASNIHHRVFADQNTDAFEFMLIGAANIEGNTYFGPALREATDDYDKVMEKVDRDRIEKEPVLIDEQDEGETDE